MKKWFKKLWGSIHLKRAGKIRMELSDEFQYFAPTENKEILIDRFHIKTNGRYNPVEIRDRLKRDMCIVEIETGDYARDKEIANIVFDILLNNYNWERKK